MQRWATLSSSSRSPCVAPSGNLVAATSSGHIVEFVVSEEKGVPQTKVLFELEGQPSGIAFESDGSIVICDASSQSLLVSENQSEASVLCSEYENQSMIGPSHCVIDSKGRRFFTDSGPFGTTNLYSPKGSIFCINSENILRPLVYQRLAQPTDLAFSPDEKCLYVAESLNNRILRFVETSNGIFIGSIFHQFSGCVGPSGIAIDGDGNLYISRFEHKGLETGGFISVLDPSGKLIAELASEAPELTGIAIDPSTNNLYITENSTASIYQIHVDTLLQKKKPAQPIM